MYAEIVSSAVAISVLRLLCIFSVSFIIAILPLNNIIGSGYADSEITTLNDDGQETIAYAESSGIGAHPLSGHTLTSDGSIPLVKEEPFTIFAEFVFKEHKLPHQDYTVIFQIADDNDFTYAIYQVIINNTKTQYHQLSKSLYGISAESRYGISAYVTPTIDKHGNYTIQAFAWTDLDNPLPLADTARSTITVFERNNAIRKGDVSLSIETSKTVHLVDMAPANMKVALTNLGNSDLIIKGSNDQIPLTVNLSLIYKDDDGSKIVGKRFSPQCYLDNNQSNHVLKSTDLMISLKSRESITLECSLQDRIGPKIYLHHYEAVGILTGNIEHLNGDVDSKKPSEEFINISTKPIDFWVGSGLLS